MFRVRIRISSPADPNLSREFDAVVDTGSAYTVIPRTAAEELGLRPVRKMVGRLANGVRIVREMGWAHLSHGALSTPTWVVFGEPNDAVLLGAITLQELGLEVDPTTETLRETEAYMYRLAGPRVAGSVSS